MKVFLLSVLLLGAAYGQISFECTAFDTTKIPDLDNVCINITDLMELDTNALLEEAMADAIAGMTNFEQIFETVGSAIVNIYNDNIEILTLVFTFDIAGLFTEGPKAVDNIMTSGISLFVGLMLTPVKAAGCGAAFDKMFACKYTDPTSAREQSRDYCMNGFQKLLQQTMTLEQQFSVALAIFEVGLNSYQVITGGGSFDANMTAALAEVLEVMLKPSYGGFVCMYFGKYDTGAFAECEGSTAVSESSTLWQWILEFESVVTKARAGEITITDAFICFMGDGLLDALLAGALPF